MSLCGSKEITKRIRLELKLNYAKIFNGRRVLKPHAQVGEEHLKMINIYCFQKQRVEPIVLGGTCRIRATVLAHAGVFFLIKKNPK